MATPYTRPSRITCKCIQTRLVNKAETFIYTKSKIEPATYRTTSVCALTDNANTYLHKRSGPDPEFEEGASYILKNVTVSTRDGQAHLLVGPATQKFRTAPLVVTEDAVKAAQDALCPPSTPMSGNEDNVYSTHGYITLQGQVKKLQKVRMTRSSIPILNIKLLCGADQLDISLWKEEALCGLHIGDDVEITHLYSDKVPRGRESFHSSQYTTVKIKETPQTKQEIEILGVSQSEDTYTLLSTDDEVYTVSAEFYTGNFTSFIEELPMKILVEHINNRIVGVTPLL
ncbi:uncharacterized protein LOC109058131 [Cyprinus carpio]|uniref:Uncharacterized protein LOC109058131 n=1 Tax=Cyprinus carpio TaxID=7962 RepID=A0A9R0A7P0_CYPCA|nr:uncharacterized protein LOC109058131 [Cyprinus carpio]